MCSLLCPAEKVVVNFSPFYVDDFIQNQFGKDKEIELYFHSTNDKFTLEINSTYSHEKKLTLKVISNSKPIKVKFKEENTSANQIELKPNFQVDLPNLNPFKSINRNSKVFIFDDPKPTPVPISVGLTQMTITGNVNCEPSDFNSNNLNNLGCSTTDLNSESAYQCGYRCWTSSADYEYTFTGVKFELFGTKDPQHGKFNIIIDNWQTTEINEHSDSREVYSLLYSSDELPYGEHHIKIRNKGETYELYKLTYLPSLTAIRINSTSFTKEGGWTGETDGIGGVREYTDDSTMSASITVRCSKFWLYGSTMYWGGKMNIDYNGIQETISLNTNDRRDQVLILETSYFPFDEYNIHVSRNEGGTLTIFCIYYIDEPPPQTPTPKPTIGPTPVPISVGLTQMTITGNVNCEPSNFNSNNLNNLGCSTTDLNSESAYQCGYRCWTSSADYEYTFIGVKFELFGTKDPQHGKFNIIIDNWQTTEINEHSNSREVYSLLYSSDELPYGEHHIKIRNKGETYELYKLTYLPSLTAVRVNSTSFNKEGSWTGETDGIGGVREYTDDSTMSASITVRCSKFWLYGSTMYWGGKMNIDYNGIQETISLNTNDRRDQVLILETSYFPFDEYNIHMSRNEGGTLTIFCIYYIDEPPPQTPTPSLTPEPTPTPTPVPISVGLTQMTITGGFNCEPSYFNADNINNLGCSTTDLNSESAYQCGYRCWTSSADYEYTFTGVKFELFGTKDPQHGKFDLIIDDWQTIEINEHSNSRKLYSLLYSSDELPYGEHHVKIQNKGETYELYKLTYLPSYPVARINSTSFTKEGNWASQTDGIGGLREYILYGSGSAKIDLRCTKFWIYGSKTPWSIDMTIDFAGTKTTIDLSSIPRRDGVLLYESPDVVLDDYTLTISNSLGTITLYCIYYTDSTPLQSPSPKPTLTPSESPEPSLTPEPTPEDSPYITPIPISVGLTDMKLQGHIYCNVANFDKDNIQNLGCNINDLDIEAAYKCGYKCWSYGDANLSYTFRGVKFAIYGTFDPFHQTFDLIIDDKPPIIINEYNESRQEYTLIYLSDDLDYNDHTVSIIGRDEIYEIYKLVYWPKMKSVRVNSTQLIKTPGWTAESDGIGGVREYTNSQGNSAATTIFCNRFWVYSSTCNVHGTMLLTFRGQVHTIDLHSDQRVDAAIVFDSDEIPQDNYTLIFTSVGISMIYCIYYENDPPPATQTPYPSRTYFPETNETYIDRIFVNFIMSDQIEVIDSSQIDRISGCQFIEIIENIDFLIRLEKEIPFYDNIFDYKSSQSIVQAPLYSMYNGKLTVKNCTFNNSRCRKKEGNVLSCHPDYSIDVSFQSCTFFNCGISPNEAIINISNKDSSIKLSDCNFSFKNETAASSVFCFLGFDAEIEACNFDRCGSIYFNCQYSNGTFSFINNTATNLCQQFLNVSDMSSITEISGNVFKNVLMKKQAFIYIVHHDDEIDLKNNTFENITSKDSIVCGGGISMIIMNSEFLLTNFLFDHCYFINNVNNRTSDSKFSFGGAFHFGYSAFTSNSSVQFVNCEFRGNDCTDGKGGALVINIYDDIVLSDCIFERNKAKEEGGAIYIIDRINQQDGQEIVDQLIKNSLIVKNCQFIENQGSEGSAIYLLKNDIEFDTFEANSCKFIDNICYDNQSFCIHCSSLNKAKFINSSVSFSETYENRCRSLLLIYNESVELIESQFVNFHTINESTIQLIANQEDSLSTVSNCTIINCVSSMYSLTISNGKIFVSNCSFTFSENEISSSCSGLEINSPSHCEIYNCEFHNNNNKVLNGGSLYIHTENDKRLDKLKIDGLLFNNCIGSSFRTISIIHNRLTEERTVLNNLQIHNISTGGSIYGIHVNNDVLFDHFVFQDNQFSNELGGGYGSYLIPPNHITFTDCLWKNNYCSDNGGAFGGVLYNIETLLELKSLSFINCQFTTNSALGNGGALYINMASDLSPIKIEGCLFEVNRASGDCGAIFIETKNIVVIESCTFVNNSAFKSLSVNSPTDTLYIHGNGYVLLNNTNFSKGTYPNEQSNYQFSHINSHINEAVNFNITISYCMFSIINPNMNQLFASEVENSGFFYISYSTFTHFITQQNQNQNQNAFLLLESGIEQEKDDYKQMNNFLASQQQDYNHLFTDLNAPVYIVQCCFDNDEYIIKTATSRSKINNNNNDFKLTTTNNSLNAECFYPKIIDEMIIEIENFEYSNGPIVSINPEKRNKSNKTRNIIIGTVVGAACLIAIVVSSILIPYMKKKKKKNDDEIPEKINIKSIEFDSDQEIEMTQETNDVINFKYSTYSFFSSHLVSQENSTIHSGRKIHSPTSTSTSSDFEEAKWDNSYV